MRTIAELPVFVAREGAGDQQNAPAFHIGKQSLPRGLIQRLRRRQNHELRRSEFCDLILSDNVGSYMQVIGKSANSLLLRLELQIRKNGELCSLRGHDGNGGLLRILQVALEQFREGG